MIRGYAEPVSVAAGEGTRLRLSADVPWVHVSIYRLGGHDPAVAVWGPIATEHYPEGTATQPWDWPPVPVQTDVAWRSGVYVAFLHSCVGDDHTGCVPDERPQVDGREGRALFVVRPARGAAPAPLLYKIPLSTYHAYNFTGGGSLYHGESLDAAGRRVVTLSRPGGGTGGALSFPAAVDLYDPASPREGVTHWDLPFLEWLERAGYRADVCTDLDLDRDPGLLTGHAAVVSAGHDEYWSAGTRDAVERFVQGGGSAAFFSGNLCFWRVTLEQDRIICNHPPVASVDSDQWWRIRSETALSGVTYRNGGGWWSGARDPVGYTVQDAGHWVYQGSGVRDGDVFGAEDRLVGYECDGAELDLSDPAHIRPRPIPGQAPVHLLGTAPLGPGWQDRPRQEQAVATMVVMVPGGVVFTAGTTDWPRLLAAGHPVVERITRNVLDRLILPVRPLHTPSSAPAGTRIEAWIDGGLVGPVDWQVSRGRVHGTDALATLDLPEEPGTVTLSAIVYENGRPVAFATATVVVLTATEVAQLAVLARVRALLAGTPPDPHPGEAPGPGNRPLADPRWAGIPDGLRRALTAEEAAEIASLAGSVQQAAIALEHTLLAEVDTDPRRNGPKDA